MFRLPTEAETQAMAEQAERAMNDHLAVEVTYLRFLKVHAKGAFPKARTVMPPFARKATGHIWFNDHLSERFGVREMLDSVPTRRVMEPVKVDLTSKPHAVPWSRVWEHAWFMDAVSHSPNGPRPRTVRLDHVIVRGGVPQLRVIGPARYRDTAYDPTINRTPATA